MTIRPHPKPLPRGRKPRLPIARSQPDPALRTWRCPACGSRVPIRVSVCPSCRTRHGTKLGSIGGRLNKALRAFTLDRADHKCEKCGKTEREIVIRGGRLEDAHYERRGKKATKWHPGNRAALCSWPDGAEGGCHRIIDTYTPSHERRAFFVSVRGEDEIKAVDDLVRVAWDRDYGEIVTMLRKRGIMK